MNEPRQGASSTGTADTPSEREVTEFLIALAEALHSVSIPTQDVERRVRDAAAALGVGAEALVLQSAVLLQAGRPGALRLRRIDFDTHWNLRRLGALRALSDDVASGRLGFAEARAQLGRIMTHSRRFPAWQVALAYALYGAVVAARVRGGWPEMLAGALIGLLAGAIHIRAASSRSVDLQQTFLGAFAGSLCAFGLALVLPGFDQSRALFGGVVLLVPAMVVTIGTYELADDALESGLFRLAYGLLRFLMLGFGVLAAIKLWQLFADLPARGPATPLPWPLVLAFVVVGGAVALGVCLQARRRDLPWIVLGILLAFGLQELTRRVLGGDGSPFLTAFVVGAAGFLAGRLANAPPGTVIIPGFLQIAPGFLGTESLLRLLGGDPRGQNDTFFHVLMVALQLVTGLATAVLVFGRRGARSRALRARAPTSAGPAPAGIAPAPSRPAPV